ncbi:MAG: hypothetical protein O2780_05545 [Proteobacteria bacterium]|nr:hypothetical protein [Pseudomonadota bacterium]
MQRLLLYIRYILLMSILGTSAQVIAENSFLTLGPLSDDQAATALSVLSADHADYLIRSQDSVESLGFIVVTPPLPSSSAGVQLIERLIAAGESDLLYITTGEYTGRVSAGVFTSQERADERAAHLQRSGFDFGVIERGRRVTLTVIDVNSRPDDALIQSLRQIVPAEVFQRHADRFELTTTSTTPATPSLPPAPTPGSAAGGATERPDSAADLTNAAPISTSQAMSPVPPETVAVPVDQPGNLVPGPAYWGLLTLLVLIIAVLVFLPGRRRREPGNQAASTYLPFMAQSEPGANQADIFDLDDLARRVLSGPHQTGVAIPLPGGADSTLLDDVLLLARVNSGTEPVHHVAFDPTSLLEDIDAQSRSLAETRGISLNFSLDASPAHSAPAGLPALVSSDPGKLARVVQTLLRHCIGNTDSGRVILTANYDPGPGILGIDITYPGDATETELFDITTRDGLRLIVAQRLTELLGGGLTATHRSDHSWTLTIGVRANALELPTPELPGNQSLEEIIAAAEQARAESDQRLAALRQTQADAASQAQQHALTERRLEDEVEKLSTELADARNQVTVEAEKKAEVESTALARVDALERDLDETRTSLASETRRRENADAAVLAASQALETEVAAVKAAAARTEETHRARVDESNREIESLNRELEQAMERLETEVHEKVSKERDAAQRLKSVESDLREAQARAEREANIRSSAEQQAAGEIAQLNEALSAARSEQSRLGAHLVDQTRYQDEIDRLQNALTDARTRLDQETEVNARAGAEAAEQVRALLAQAQQARQEADDQASHRAAMQTQLEAMRAEMQHLQDNHELAIKSHELAIANQKQEKDALAATLDEIRSDAETAHRAREQAEAQAARRIEAVQSELEQARRDATERIETLTRNEKMLHQRIEEARAGVADEIDRRRQAEQDADETVSMLNRRLAELKERASEESQQRKLTERNARLVVQSLRSKLDAVTSQQSRASDASEEVAELRTAVADAEQKLELERQRQGRQENVTGEQIGSLLDELNGAKSAADHERRLREEVEQSSLEMVNSIERELAETREALSRETTRREEAESAAKQDSQQMAQHLTNAMDHARDLQERHEAITESLNKANAELNQARLDAANHAQAEATARAELTNLTARLEAISKTHATGASPSGTSDPAGSSPPVRTPATDNPIIFTRMKRFVKRLKEQIAAMNVAYDREQYLDLVVICNWIKNETQSLRLSEFEPPVREIELQLRNQQFARIKPQIDRLTALSESIDFDPAAPPDIIIFESSNAPVELDGTPVSYPLPKNERKAELLENFVSQLGSELLEMQTAWQDHDADQLKKNCKWITKYASRMNFLEVVYATEDLQEALESGDASDISTRLTEFINLYTRIDLVRAA